MNRGTFRHRRLHWLATIIAICAMGQGATCRAQSRSAATQQLEQRLAARVSVAWEGQELATALQRLADSQRLPLWIDRRVDPNAPIELTANDQPLSDVLDSIGAPHGWAATPYHGMLYFGPKQTASELLTLSALARQSIAKAPPDVRSRWLKPEAWTIARLSEPRGLLKQLARSAGAAVVDEREVPHDLWPERQLPPMSALDRAILLLSGFDLTCQISADGRKLRVLPIKRPLQLIGPAPPTASRSRPPQPRSAAKGTVQRFTLKIENQPAGRVLDQLARQLQLEVTWDAALQQTPAFGREANVSCDVHEADLDELLTAVLMPAGLTFEREERKVRIRRGE
ncbi:MAG: hypothetical protein H0T51_26230 [Pirellulales bacterium]|nr:hypothetical protein [Pirellulales bacterium]